jgi:hypothetical protein
MPRKRKMSRDGLQGDRLVDILTSSLFSFLFFSFLYFVFGRGGVDSIFIILFLLFTFAQVGYFF